MNQPNIEKECAAFLSRMADDISTFIQKISGGAKAQKSLAEFEPGQIVTIAGDEFIVLEHLDGETALITKKCIGNETKFSDSNNNYVGSFVDDICVSFAEHLANFVGEDNVIEFDLDLTSHDGLKDYGQIRRKVALMTADMYRRYVYILDKHLLDAWWWLSTPWSTEAHESHVYDLCVSPSGCLGNGHCFISDIGVRPFCILKSNIFVSD